MSAKEGTLTPPERMRVVVELWAEGVTTKGIADKCQNQFHVEVTKNMVVGAVRRSPLCEARPSPIRAAKEKPERTPGVLGRPRTTLPPLPSDARRTSAPPTPTAPRRIPAEAPVPGWAERKPMHVASTMLLPLQFEPMPCLAERSSHRRRDGSGCMFPKGDKRPYTMCDADLDDVRDTYCKDCKGRAYTRLHQRER